MKELLEEYAEIIADWDNAPHPHEVETMPHHKHVDSNQNVQPSEEMNTRKVLAFIAKIIGIFVLIGFTAFAALAQDEKPKTPEKPKRRLSFSQLFKEIENCKDTIYRLENAVLYIDEKTDQRFIDNNDSIKIQKMDTIFVNKEIFIENCTIEYALICKIVFTKKIFFRFISSKDLIFIQCVFNDFSLVESKIAKNFYFNKCYSKGFCILSSVDSPDGTIRFEKSIFERKLKSNYFKNVQKQFTVSYSKVGSLSMEDCSFKYTFGTEYIEINYCKFEQFLLSNNNIESNIYFDSNHFGVFYFYKNLLKGLINFTVIDFDEKNFQSDFKQFAKKMSVRYEFIGSLDDSYVPYKGLSDFELANKEAFKRLISVYATFYETYKKTQDTESANACYVEMKTLETRKSAYEYRKNPSLKAFLDWQMNEFLHTFSDYGTDYVKSLIYAFYVILLFALIYFIFPSQEDNLSKNRFLKFFTKAIQYFRTDTQLTDFEQEKRKEELEKLENFRQNLVNSQTEIPRIISLLGKPFYYQNLYFTEFALWLLHRTDLAKGKWSEIPAKRKLFLGGLVTLYFVFYVCNGLFMRALNAFALSLNFFTTLGYGEMQAKGWIKYLAVLEGAVGWFLLTVFSASLVSQLLQ